MTSISRLLTRIHRLCSIKWQFRLLISLMLCSCAFYFVILHHNENKKPFAFAHLNIGPTRTTDNYGAPFLVIIPHSTSIGEEKKNEEKTLEKTDELAFEKLREFLDSMREFDGATCMQPSTHNGEQLWKVQEISDTARNISLESSWCRFMKREWSLHVRNTGPVQKVKLRKAGRSAIYPSFPKAEVNSTIDDSVVFQNCNIVQGPFIIRKEAFHRIGGLLEGFGKVTLLEFFLRSKGELKIAKLANCKWTPKITRTDRGTLEGSNNFSEYSTLGNEHQILRIVTENRIEWAACVANWKLCAEKPYVRPRDLTSIAAPICCSVVLGQMLIDFTRALEKVGIQYRLIYGTLLGAVRSQAIIPWTYDVDISISNSDIESSSTFAALQKELGNQYYVGDSYFNMPRGHPLMAPFIEVDTAQFFDGPDDLQGNALFSEEIEQAVKDMLPLSYDWRDHGYVDFYCGDSERMSGYSLVTINNQTFVTVKDVDKQLTNWFGENYREPIVKGNWTGFSEEGNSPSSNC